MTPSQKPGTAERKRRSTQRFEILNAFVDESMRRLKPAECVVWTVLFRDTKADHRARASVDDLATRTGLSRSTILRALKTLETQGFVKVAQRGGLNQGPSVYIVFPYAMTGTNP